jgi:hypothetical protein
VSRLARHESLLVRPRFLFQSVSEAGTFHCHLHEQQAVPDCHFLLVFLPILVIIGPQIGPCPRCCERERLPRAENGRYASQETALMCPLAPAARRPAVIITARLMLFSLKNNKPYTCRTCVM